jgi:hypothetical protein
MRRYCRYGGNATVIVLSNLQTTPIGPLMRDIQVCCLPAHNPTTLILYPHGS